jgi:hypothetical protein
LLRQKKVPKEKATLLSALRVPARPEANAGSETNSLRSNMFRFFFRIDSRPRGASPRVERPHQASGPRDFFVEQQLKIGAFDVPPLGRCRENAGAGGSRSETCLSAASSFRFPPAPALSREPEGQRLRGRLSLLTFFGEAKKVSSRRATPGTYPQGSSDIKQGKKSSGFPSSRTAVGTQTCLTQRSAKNNQQPSHPSSNPQSKSCPPPSPQSPSPSPYSPRRTLQARRVRW